MLQCFVIQRKYTKALYSITNEGGSRNVVAFRRKKDAKMFVSWIVKYDNIDRPVKDPVPPKQPLVVLEYPECILYDVCADNLLGLSIIEENGDSY